MQSWSSASGYNSTIGHKALDFALAIAGWPTIYTVSASAVGATGLGGDLNVDNGFTAAKPWMNIPKIAGSSVRGRPEEGGCTFGQLDVAIQDRLLSGTRSLTDLASRAAYLNGTSSGHNTRLNGALSRTGTTVTVDDTTGFASSGTIYVGREAINYSSKTGTTFTVATNGRGYLLTDKMPHLDNVKVYDFMPSLVARPAYLYKGYQDLTLDKWAPVGFGTLAGVAKSETFVHFAILHATWDTMTGNTLVNPWVTSLAGSTTTPTPAYGKLVADLLSDDFASVGITANAVGALNDGHFFAVIEGEHMAILAAT